jgi:hypothetical protein
VRVAQRGTGPTEAIAAATTCSAGGAVTGSTNGLSPSELQHPQLSGRFLQSPPPCRALVRRARSSRGSAARPEHRQATGRPRRWLARRAAVPSPARQARRSAARPTRRTAPVAGPEQQSSRAARSRSSPTTDTTRSSLRRVVSSGTAQVAKASGRRRGRASPFVAEAIVFRGLASKKEQSSARCCRMPMWRDATARVLNRDALTAASASGLAEEECRDGGARLGSAPI